MAAKGNFACRREPADRKRVTLAQDKGGFRQVVLGCDGLHQIVGQGRVQHHDGGRVARKETVGEGIGLD